MGRVVLHMHDNTIQFWAEAVTIAYYTANRVFIRHKTKKISYELWTRRKLNLKCFRVFDNQYYILNDGENLGKFDSKSDLSRFLGYSNKNKAYKVNNQNSQVI